MDGDDPSNYTQVREGFRPLDENELNEFYGTQENPLHVDVPVAQEPASTVPANSATNEPELQNQNSRLSDLSEPEDTTDPSTESRLQEMMNEYLPLVPSETQIVAQEPIFGVVSPITHVQVRSLIEHTPLIQGSSFYVSGTSVPLGIVEEITGPETQRNYLVRLTSETNLILDNSDVTHVTLSRDSKRLQKETGKRKAESVDEYDNSRNKMQNTTMLVGSSSNAPVTQGFEAGPSVGGGGSSGNSQTVLANIRQSQLRLIQRQRLNQNPIHGSDVTRDGPPRSTLGQGHQMQQQNTTMVVGGSSNLPNSGGQDQDSGGVGSSSQTLRAHIHRSMQQYIERRTARINQNPIQGPDLPQPIYQGGAVQPHGGRGQGDLNLQLQFQQQGRGQGDQNRGRGRDFR